MKIDGISSIEVSHSNLMLNIEDTCIDRSLIIGKIIRIVIIKSIPIAYKMSLFSISNRMPSKLHASQIARVRCVCVSLLRIFRNSQFGVYNNKMYNSHRAISYAKHISSRAYILQDVPKMTIYFGEIKGILKNCYTNLCFHQNSIALYDFFC